MWFCYLKERKHYLVNRFTKKRKLASGVGTYKLVAKGFKQEYGIDFEEIFSLMVKMPTLSSLLGLVAT